MTCIRERERGLRLFIDRRRNFLLGASFSILVKFNVKKACFSINISYSPEPANLFVSTLLLASLVYRSIHPPRDFSLPSSYQPRVVEPAYRARSSSTRASSGSRWLRHLSRRSHSLFVRVLAALGTAVVPFQGLLVGVLAVSWLESTDALLLLPMEMVLC